jgi:choloylglycine hydrolase
VTEADNPRTIAPWQLATWILTNFESVSEVKEKLKEIKVANVVFKKWNIVIPVHLIVTDAKGNSIVIEYIKGQLNIHDNKYGVITNSPPFDWMITNIRNYLRLSPNNLIGKTINGKNLTPFGEGSGMFGVPGDFTPPSRFIRGLFFSIASLTVNNSQDASMQMFHILNNFDIPEGTVRSEKGKVTAYDRTQWTSVHDLNKKNYYYKTEGNTRIRVVKLINCNLNAEKIFKLTMETPEDIQDVTSDLK